MTRHAVMRQDWDERARKDSFYYIATWQPQWDEAGFFASGERDYAELVRPVLERLGFEPAGKRMLEVGCGVGRMTRAFARRFGHLAALDVSGEMLRQGRALHPDFANVTWLQGDGAGLQMLRTASFDFVFAYLVLQHVPEKELSLAYVREMLRVLRPGGIFLFQFCSHTQPTMNWRGRLTWGAIDRLRKRWPAAGRRLATALHLDTLAAGDTWRGAILNPREVLEAVWQEGGVVAGISGWQTPHTWCSGYRQAASRE